MNLRLPAATAALALVLAAAASSAPAAPPAPPAAAKASAEVPSALILKPEDLRIEQRADGGYHLFIRAKAGIGSILLTESTKDPENKTDSYAFRSLEKNPVNDGEARVLDGRKLPTDGEHRYLVDSTPEPDQALGKAFHLFIPSVVAWGHSWSRGGKVYIHDGTFINIRAFAKPYADYSGAFADNPYLVRVARAPGASGVAAKVAPPAAPPAAAPSPAAVPSPAPAAAAPSSAPAAASPTSLGSAPTPDLTLYYPETLSAFGRLAAKTKGELRCASSVADILVQIDAILARIQGRSLDFVLCIDVTDSMQNGVDELKAKLPALLAQRTARFSSARFGIVSYKDYFEEYLYRRQDFVNEPAAYRAELDELRCGGGRDIPEAVYEGLYAAIREFPWTAEAKVVVLVGDAPPHPVPMGSIDESDVLDSAAEEGVTLYAVAVPK